MSHQANRDHWVYPEVWLTLALSYNAPSFNYLPENLEYLVYLRVPREKRFPCAHLRKDAADRPHVDTS